MSSKAARRIRALKSSILSALGFEDEWSKFQKNIKIEGHVSGDSKGSEK